jgi:hypothetical protein
VFSHAHLPILWINNPGASPGSGYSAADPINLCTGLTTDAAASGWSDGGYGATQSDAGNSVQGVTSSSIGSGTAHNNLQPTIIFNKIIKT